MTPLSEFDLQPHNTLAAPSIAEFFVGISSVEQLTAALAWARQQAVNIHILGDGSNVVLRGRLPGLTLKIEILGREILAATPDEVWLKVGAGENWHNFVSWCLAQQFYGLENLALIPGTVGAAPVQNIGAYGVEVCQFIERVEGVELATGTAFSLSRDECCFSYRDSVFKQNTGRRRIISHVLLRLSKHGNPVVSYPALIDALRGAQASPNNVFDTVCRIRTSKLPDPLQTPSCGSFFKNPVVSYAQFAGLIESHPEMPNYDAGSALSQTHRKIAAGWLIDQAGWSGQTRYGVAVHAAQALVLTNPNRRDASAILSLAKDIQHSVQLRFGISLEIEPQILGDERA